MTMIDHFAVLGIPRDATDEQVGAAYRKAAKQHHPDHGGDAQMFRLILQARDALRTPAQRRRHAAELDQRSRRSAQQVVIHAEAPPAPRVRTSGTVKPSRSPWVALTVNVSVIVWCGYCLGWFGYSMDGAAWEKLLRPVVELAGGWGTVVAVAAILAAASCALLFLEKNWNGSLAFGALRRVVVVASVLWAAPLAILAVLVLALIAVVAYIGWQLLRSVI